MSKVNGMITYMRTESNKYSQAFIEKAGKYISLKYGNEFVGKTELISNIISKLPHEAIRVTDLILLKIDGEPKLKGLYSLIYRNTIESCMSIATYKSYNMNIIAPLSNLYTKQIDVPLFNGWTQYKGVNVEPNYEKYIECLSNKEVK